MSVLVERKGNTAPYSGGPNRGGHSSTSGAMKGGVRERQKAVDSTGAPADGAKKMNMIAVQRVDPCLIDILSTVPQVVLYQYETNSNTWERTSIEGTLFIYSRSSVPSHGFVLLNRLSSDNLQEVVHPDSEYRVQGQFVLFRKQSEADKVYGLCFTTSSHSSATGQLLNSLRGQTNGTVHQSGRTPPLAVSMRSQSVPSFPQSQVGGSRALGEKMDIMELLESAGNSYLNQAFSDETGSSSQDSPPREGISFTAHPLASSHANHRGNPIASSSLPNNRGIPITSSSLPNDRGNPIGVDKTPSSSSGHHHKGASEKSIKRSTPRTIPKLVNMSTTPPSAPFTNPPPSSSSRPPSHLVQSEVQYSSRAAKKSASKPTPTSRHSSLSSDTPPPTAQQMTPRGGSTPPTTATRNPLRSSTAPGHVGRRKLHVPPPTRGRTNGSSSSRGGASSLLQEVIPEQPLARQLFEPPPPATTRERSSTVSTTSSVNTAESAKTAPAHLESLFSQSLPASLTATKTSDKTPPPTQPIMSLAEVEKQMADEVSSPPFRSFTVFPLPTYLANLLSSSQPPSSQLTSSQLPSTTPSSQPTSSQSSRSTNAVTTAPGTTGAPPSSSQPVTTSAGSEENHILRQPSSFSTATPPSRAQTTALITHFTTGSGITTLATAPFTASPTPVVQRAATSDSIQLHIEPPSPIVSSTSQTLQLSKVSLMKGVFPDVPPLMHSPGMRAPPVSSGSLTAENNSSKTGRGSRGKGGEGRGRRGRRSPGKSGSPVGAGESSSPQPEVVSSSGNVSLMGVVGTPPSRSWSVPGNMNPDVSVSVPSQPATQPHTLLSPQQFSLSETPPLTHTPPPPSHPHSHTPPPRPPGLGPPQGHPLSREQFKKTLLFLIQNDEDFITHLHYAYHLRVSGQRQ